MNGFNLFFNGIFDALLGGSRKLAHLLVKVLLSLLGLSFSKDSLPRNIAIILTMCTLVICGFMSFLYFGENARTSTAHPPIRYAPSIEISQNFSVHPFRYVLTITPKIRWDPSYSSLTIRSTEEGVEPVSIKALLKFPELFHQKTVTVRGMVTQPEIHLDDTELFFDFVFILKDGDESLVVFGQHDRTQGSSPIAMGNTVEVTGIFWKDRFAHDYHFENNLEAITVTPYPSLIPNST